MLWPFLFREIGMWIVSPSWAWVPTPRESHPFLCRPDPRARATGAGNQINSLRPNLFLPLPLRFFSFRSLSSQLGHRQPLTPLLCRLPLSGGGACSGDLDTEARLMDVKTTLAPLTLKAPSLPFPLCLTPPPPHSSYNAIAGSTGAHTSRVIC